MRRHVAWSASQADLAKLVARGKLTEIAARERVARIRCVTHIEELRPCHAGCRGDDVEDLRLKAELLARIESVIDPTAVITSNTSSLSITALGATLSPSAAIRRLPFLQPGRGDAAGRGRERRRPTSRDVVDTLLATAAAWGETAVHCQSTPGFIVNRVARPFYAEACVCLRSGQRTARPSTRSCATVGGYRMGPCALMDLIGHDVNFAVTRGVYDGFFQDPRYRPSPAATGTRHGRPARKRARGLRYGEGASDPAPATAPAEARPSRVVIEGDLGPAAKLAALATAAGILVEQRSGTGVMRLEGMMLALTDGRTATERTSNEGPCALFDLALDYGTASRIGLAFPDGL